jgi:hypothetical protein
MASSVKNPGTYILSGQIQIYNGDEATASVYCGVLDASQGTQTLAPGAYGSLGPYGTITLPMNGAWTASAANTSIWLECYFSGASVGVEAFGYDAFTAIQVQ